MLEASISSLKIRFLASVYSLNLTWYGLKCGGLEPLFKNSVLQIFVILHIIGSVCDSDEVKVMRFTSVFPSFDLDSFLEICYISHIWVCIC